MSLGVIRGLGISNGVVSMDYEPIDFKEVRSVWRSVANSVSGEFKYRETVQANIKGPIHKLGIVYNYRGFPVEMKSSVIVEVMGFLSKYRCEYKPLTTRMDAKCNDSFSFNYWESYWLEKIFSRGRAKSGYEDFDKFYTVECSSIEKVRQLLGSESLRKALLCENSPSLRIEATKEGIGVTIKEFGDCTKEKMLKEQLLLFEYVFEALIRMGVLER